MDWVEILHRPDWATAVTSGLFAAISTGTTGWIAWKKMRRTYRLEDRTEAILRKLLRDRDYKRRKFETIKGFVPLADDKLREALLRAGAVQITGQGDDYWTLIENAEDRVFPKRRRNRKEVT